MKCKICNKDIPEKRIDILKKMGKKLTCINCSTEEKVVGFQVNTTKENRTIQVVSKDIADEMFRVSKQGGVNYGTVN